MVLNLSFLSRQLHSPWARSYSSSTGCQEVGIVAYVSSNMSVREGGEGDGSKLLKKSSQRAESFYWIPFLCADCWHCRTNSQTDEGGGKIPSSTTKRLGLFLVVLSSSQPNDELCSSSPPAYASIVGKELKKILVPISVTLWSPWLIILNTFHRLRYDYSWIVPTL